MVSRAEPAALRAALFDPALPEATALRHLRRLSAESRAVLLAAQAPQAVPPALFCGRPALVLGRAGDRMIPCDAVLRAAAYHGAGTTLFDGAGHAMMLDLGWQAVADCLLGWAAGPSLRLAAREEVLP